MSVELSEEKQKLHRMIDCMGPEDVLRMLDYAAFLRYLEEKEDAEDIVYAREHRGEPSAPLNVILKNYEKKYGELKE
jgi:hypothetical protein